ncbi:hypothetical protein ON010_g16899 [Phytophthora cinnamomi]|nr:hypothetical protein ON010_g16899 [Phytophthora cinnamomi]
MCDANFPVRKRAELYRRMSYVVLLLVVQSIVESPEPRLPEVDADGEAFTPEFHEFIGRCLKKEPSERASVKELLASPWLQQHNATTTERCVQRCATWLQKLHLVAEDASEAKGSHGLHRAAKDMKTKQVDEDDEIEEAIEIQEDSD